MKNKLTLIYLTALLLVGSITQGCGSFMHGYTEDRSLNRYLLVNEASKNFGFKRLQYNASFYELKPFLERHGMPDFFLEEKAKGTPLLIHFFYVKKNEVMTMENRGLGGNLTYVETRPLTDYEKATYENLVAKGE